MCNFITIFLVTCLKYKALQVLGVIFRVTDESLSGIFDLF